jgi:hypothetical protein
LNRRGEKHQTLDCMQAAGRPKTSADVSHCLYLHIFPDTTLLCPLAWRQGTSMQNAHRLSRCCTHQRLDAATMSCACNVALGYCNNTQKRERKRTTAGASQKRGMLASERGDTHRSRKRTTSIVLPIVFIRCSVILPMTLSWWFGSRDLVHALPSKARDNRRNTTKRT